MYFIKFKDLKKKSKGAGHLSMREQKQSRFSSHFKERSQSFAYWLQYKNIREEEKDEDSNMETEANLEDPNNNNNYQLPGNSTEI